MKNWFLTLLGAHFLELLEKSATMKRVFYHWLLTVIIGSAIGTVINEEEAFVEIFIIFLCCSLFLGITPLLIMVQSVKRYLEKGYSGSKTAGKLILMQTFSFLIIFTGIMLVGPFPAVLSVLVFGIGIMYLVIGALLTLFLPPKLTEK